MIVIAVPQDSLGASMQGKCIGVAHFVGFKIKSMLEGDDNNDSKRGREEEEEFQSQKMHVLTCGTHCHKV